MEHHRASVWSDQWSGVQPEGKRETVAYTGKMEEDDILNFAKAESLPTVVPFNDEYSERIFSVGVSRHLLFIGKASDLKAGSKPFAAFTKVAQKLKNNRDFIFVSVNAEDENGERVVGFFEAEQEDMPVIYCFQTEPVQRKYRYIPSPALSPNSCNYTVEGNPRSAPPPCTSCAVMTACVACTVDAG
jgi:hypothetical protein